jgi:hypothetical protein
MLGQLAQRACLPGSPVTLWKSAWSDIQPSVCTCLLSFLEVADFAPKVKWNTCTAVQRLLQWNAWDEHTMCVFCYLISRNFVPSLPTRQHSMHLGSVLCSTVANDPHLKVTFCPFVVFYETITNKYVQVVKSACLAAKFVPAAAIVPSGVKDVASRFLIQNCVFCFSCCTLSLAAINTSDLGVELIFSRPYHLVILEA